MSKIENEKILEKDLWKPVSDFFINNGYSVRSEVNHCDISAVKEDNLVIIELKRNLTVELLSQAVKRQKISDLVYIAVPKPKKMKADNKWKDLCHLIRRLELGLIFVSFKGKESFIEIVIDPSPFDRARSIRANKKQRDSIIKEIKGRYNDMNIGGSTREKLVTAYRESSVFIACCLDRFGPMSPKKLRELGTDPKKTTSMLSKNYYGWFGKVDTGIYKLTDEGKRNIESYKELAEYYYNKIDEKKD